MTRLEGGRLRSVVWTVAGLLAAALVASVLTAVVVVAQIRSDQVDNTAKSDKRDETLALIQDCTQPSGKCYKRGQRATAKAVGDIGATNILAVVCALQVPDSVPLKPAIRQVSDCVADQLAARRPKP